MYSSPLRLLLLDVSLILSAAAGSAPLVGVPRHSLSSQNQTHAASRKAGACQQTPPNPATLQQIKQLYDARQWAEVVCLTPVEAGDSAEIDYYRGMALAKLKRWPLAEESFERGRKKAPKDKRFPTELAGVAFAEKKYGAAKTNLNRVLKLDPRDAYAINFLATIYFLQGNLPAAVKVWNRIGMPRIQNIQAHPQLRIDPVLLNHAFAFSPGEVLEESDLYTADALLSSLGIFSKPQIALAPAASGGFDASFTPVGRRALGGSWTADLVTLLRGAPYETIYPEWFNIHGDDVNFSSLLRWDPNKERVFAAVSGPLWENPHWRYRVSLDARREYWNISNTFFASAAPVNDMQLEKVDGSAALENVINGRLGWDVGVDLSGRTFRNIHWSDPSAAQFFRNGTALELRSSLNGLIFDDPARRLTVNGSVSGQFGKLLDQGSDPFVQVETGLDVNWFPRAEGDDYQMTTQLRSGRSWGAVPFDDLFILGLERDNDLWLRAHIGTENGRKGSAPLGRNYAVVNWDDVKNIYHNGFFRVKLGPFLDAGKISDPTDDFGSHRWLVDTGLELKFQVLGSATVELFLGRDLRGGRTAFYGTTGGL